jgi:hypothetical protein
MFSFFLDLFQVIIYLLHYLFSSFCDFILILDMDRKLRMILPEENGALIIPLLYADSATFVCALCRCCVQRTEFQINIHSVLSVILEQKETTEILDQGT